MGLPVLEDIALRLAALSNLPLRAYSTFDFGRDRDERARSVIADKDSAEDLLLRFRAELPAGFVAFLGTTSWLGDEAHDGIELVVAPGASQFDILRIARSDAVNYDMDTEALIAKLVEYDRAYGIDILHAETDTIEFALVQMPDPLDAFCADLYEFCPDIVEQGCQSIDALEEEIAAAGRVFLWWD
jgi:hypothetical protein